ncbi:MAG: ADOP family duplicated permease [Bryobacter sp.]|nr:ADOP family duplicated permease [Bryobacter sp.]
MTKQLRSLASSPLSLAAALLAFALGIGANTAMYSICSALLFRPVELGHLERLVVFESFLRGDHQGLFDVSPADFTDLRGQLQSLEDLGFAEEWSATITRDGEPEQVSAARVSANWFGLTGAPLVAGRAFLPGENAPGRTRIAVVTEGLALRRFGAQKTTASVVGQQIRLDGEDHMIVGVLRETARLPNFARVYVPYSQAADFAHQRTAFELYTVGRLRGGASLSTAQAELGAAFRRLAEQFPASHQGRSLVLVSLKERIAGTNDLAASYVRLLLFATGFVLLIACANVTNLQLARITGRAREFAIRSALGANPWRIAGLVLSESLLLALLGSLVGIPFAMWAVEGMKRMLPSEIWQYIPMWPELSVNWTALGVTLGLSVLAGFATAFWPAWQSTRSDAQESLREGGRSMSSSRSRQWFRGAMIGVQMMLALVLLIGAGLMVRGTQVLFERFAAWQPEKVGTLQLVLPRTKYPDPPLRGNFIRKLEEQLAALPARQDFGLVNFIPLGDSMSIVPFAVEGRPEARAAEQLAANNLIVSPGYFAAMQVQLRSGRLLASTDGAETDPVCVVDERFAADVFPNEPALGRRISPLLDDSRPWCRIVGIVANKDHNPWERSSRRTLYRAMAQVQPRLLSVVVRTDAPMETMLPALKQAVYAVDPEQPVRMLYSQQDLLDQALAGMKLVALMMSVLGLIALLLSAVGIFSVVSYVVSERTSEIGMRMAMGASEWDILRLVSHQTLLMLGLGLALGLGLGFALAQLFRGLIWGVSSRDFLSLASVSLLLALVGGLAMYLPARRALRLDPMQALRHD